MKLSFALCALPAALAFSNTAPFFGLDTRALQLSHLVRSDALEVLVDLPALLCSGKVNTQLLWVRMKGLDFDAQQYLTSDAPDTHIDAVFYPSAEVVSSMTTIDSCLDSQVKVSQGSLVENFARYRLNVVEVTSEAQLADVTSKFKELVSNPHIWIQGLPTFAAPHLLTFEQVKEFVGDKIGEDLDEIEIELFKRTESNDQDASALEAEIESDFRAAESYIIAEGDKPVGLYDVGGNDKSNSSSSKAPKHSKKVDNLFTNYQFFTPGILLCLIVSFALVGVLYVALGWIASLEITYKSFDKQVDYEKKQE